MAKKYKDAVLPKSYVNLISSKSEFSDSKSTAGASSVEVQEMIEKINHMHFILGGLLESVRSGFALLIGMTSFQYVLMQVLDRSSEATQWTVRSVAREMHMTDAYVSTEIADLVRKGMIAKTGNPADRRVSFLSLTDKGHQSLAAIAPVQAMINKSLLARLDADRAKLYAESLAVFIAEAGSAIDVLRELTNGQRSTSLNKMRS